MPRSALLRRALVVLAALALAPPPATAQAPNGVMSLTGSARFTSSGGTTVLDFLPPAGPPGGTFTVTPPATGTFAALPGSSGTILDLSTAVTPPGATVLLPGFITVAGAPTLRFDFTRLFAGAFPSGDCAAVPAVGQSCTPAGSPFNFSNFAGGSSLSFTVEGGALNLTTAEASPFVASFTATFATPFQDQLALLAAPGGVTTTYSGALLATAAATPTVVPEPATLGLLGAGLAALGAMRAARSHRRRAADS